MCSLTSAQRRRSSYATPSLLQWGAAKKINSIIYFPLPSLHFYWLTVITELYIESIRINRKMKMKMSFVIFNGIKNDSHTVSLY